MFKHWIIDLIIEIWYLLFCFLIYILQVLFSSSLRLTSHIFSWLSAYRPCNCRSLIPNWNIHIYSLCLVWFHCSIPPSSHVNQVQLFRNSNFKPPAYFTLQIIIGWVNWDSFPLYQGDATVRWHSMAEIENSIAWQDLGPVCGSAPIYR